MIGWISKRLLLRLKEQPFWVLGGLYSIIHLRQHRTIPAWRLKHRSGSCGTASALPKCSIMSGCGTRIVLRGQKPLELCDRCPYFGSLFPPLAALTFAASSIICAFGLASAAPRLPYRHLELCGIALKELPAIKANQRFLPQKKSFCLPLHVSPTAIFPPFSGAIGMILSFRLLLTGCQPVPYARSRNTVTEIFSLYNRDSFHAK